MRAVGRANTRPELAVRKLLHSRGFRYRLHDKRLPGSPDIVFASRRAVIFVHGCFWHNHKCRPGLKPRSRPEFWAAKLERNADRDERNVEALKTLGWRVLIVWECELALKDRDDLIETLETFLGLKRNRVTRSP